MIVTFLGTGTSQGIPVIACDCEVCSSLDFRDKRLRTSIHIQYNNTSIVIDSGPDFRQQMLRERINHLDAIVFTHEHKDHVAGLDDIRAYNFKDNGKPMQIFATNNVQEALKREFAYIFTEEKYPGVPEVKINTIDKNNSFFVQDLNFNPIEVIHYKLPVLGFRIGDFAYITDANYISPEEKAKLKGIKILVINALRKTEHISHFNLSQALELIEELEVEAAYLTHLSHLMGTHQKVTKELPEHVHIAYDGLKLKC